MTPQLAAELHDLKITVRERNRAIDAQGEELLRLRFDNSQLHGMLKYVIAAYILALGSRPMTATETQLLTRAKAMAGWERG